MVDNSQFIQIQPQNLTQYPQQPIQNPTNQESYGYNFENNGYSQSESIQYPAMEYDIKEAPAPEIPLSYLFDLPSNSEMVVSAIEPTPMQKHQHIQAITNYRINRVNIQAVADIHDRLYPMTFKPIQLDTKPVINNCANEVVYPMQLITTCAPLHTLSFCVDPEVSKTNDTKQFVKEVNNFFETYDKTTRVSTPSTVVSDKITPSTSRSGEITLTRVDKIDKITPSTSREVSDKIDSLRAVPEIPSSVVPAPSQLSNGKIDSVKTETKTDVKVQNSDKRSSDNNNKKKSKKRKQDGDKWKQYERPDGTNPEFEAFIQSFRDLPSSSQEVRDAHECVRDYNWLENFSSKTSSKTVEEADQLQSMFYVNYFEDWISKLDAIDNIENQQEYHNKLTETLNVKNAEMNRWIGIDGYLNNKLEKNPVKTLSKEELENIQKLLDMRKF